MTALPRIAPPQLPDIVCLSPLRWESVSQRPKALMTRFGRSRRVFYFEEAVMRGTQPRLDLREVADGAIVARPELPQGLEPDIVDLCKSLLLETLLRDFDSRDFVLWYYTPFALSFTRGLTPCAIVYDCMEELSSLKDASPEPSVQETELLGLADLVFTDGRSLHEARRGLHPAVYLFPSCVDLSHFGRARASKPEDDPGDQAFIGRPRLGYVGALDETLDAQLLDHVARTRPEWQLILVGPLLLDSAKLPRRENIHYLGPKSFEELPSYLGGWDVAFLPLAQSPATRSMGPIRAPEYLAAGLPVVCTPVRDVIHPYGEMGVVRIASTPDGFVRDAAIALAHDRTNVGRGRAVDAALRGLSWDRTWAAMDALLNDRVSRRHGLAVRASAVS